MTNVLMRFGKLHIVYLGILLVCSLSIFSCGGDDPDTDDGDLSHIPYAPESYTVTLPESFPAMSIPQDNPITEDGLNLGRFLFFDPILSADSTMACASCHLPELSFTDGLAFSEGIDGIAGKRSSMSLLNVGLTNNGLFWDGRAATLEEQALLPVEDPIELHDTWPNVEAKLRRSSMYPEMFRKAFGIDNKTEISRDLAVKAIAQYERALVSSGSSKYDRVIAGLDVFSDMELIGHSLYFDDDPDIPDAECAHCHSAPLMTADDFFNNGLQEAATLLDFEEMGLGALTGIALDNGKLKAPTLRNVMLTAPYMHDGRFKNIREVIDHYNSGGKFSPNADPLMKPLGLDEYYIEALLAFLETLTDTVFINSELAQSPF